MLILSERKIDNPTSLDKGNTMVPPFFLCDNFPPSSIRGEASRSYPIGRDVFEKPLGLTGTFCVISGKLTRPLLSLWIFHALMGRGLLIDPSLTRLVGHVVTRGKRHLTSIKNNYETTSFIFNVKSKAGPQRSSNVKFCLFQHFSANWHITRELEELQSCAKALSIALLTSFCLKETVHLRNCSLPEITIF